MADTYGAEVEINHPKATFDLPGGSDGVRKIRNRAIESVRDVKWVKTDLNRCLSMELTRASMTVLFRPERNMADHYGRRVEVTLDADDFNREPIAGAARIAVNNQIPKVNGSEVEVHFIKTNGIRCEIEGVIE